MDEGTDGITDVEENDVVSEVPCVRHLHTAAVALLLLSILAV
jgi:hypothetical protein